MRMFWKIEGTRKPLYTGKAFVKYIVHRKTGKKYYCGEGKFYKKKNYPQFLAEDQWDSIQREFLYDFHYEERPPIRVEKAGFFKEYRVSSVKGYEREREYLNCFTLWEIDGLSPTMYTWKDVDIIRDKRTGKEYKRGKLVKFRNEDETPFPLAEYTDDFEYLLEINNASSIGNPDYLKDIWVSNLFKSFFGK